jgi:hypothetical protein
MQYTVKNKSSRNFEIFDGHMQSLGTLQYTTWLNNKAHALTSDNNSYHIAPANFWNSSTLVTKNGAPYAEMKYNWKLRLTISFQNGKSYVLKQKSVWRSSEHILVDNNTQQTIAAVVTSFKLRKMNFEYLVEVFDNDLSKEDNLVLPFLLLFFTKSLRVRHSAMA